MYIYRTRTRTRYWGSRQTLKLYHVHVHARTPILGSPLLPSWGNTSRPVTVTLSAWKLFCRGGDRLLLSPLPVASSSALQIPIPAVYIFLFHRLGMSLCLLSSRLFCLVLLGFVQWFRGFGIFCSDVFCSGCRQSIGLGFCWERFGNRLGCPRLGSALLSSYTQSQVDHLSNFQSEVDHLLKIEVDQESKKIQVDHGPKIKNSS